METRSVVPVTWIGRRFGVVYARSIDVPISRESKGLGLSQSGETKVSLPEISEEKKCLSAEEELFDALEKDVPSEEEDSDSESESDSEEEEEDDMVDPGTRKRCRFVDDEAAG